MESCQLQGMHFLTEFLRDKTRDEKLMYIHCTPQLLCKNLPLIRRLKFWWKGVERTSIFLRGGDYVYFLDNNSD